MCIQNQPPTGFFGEIRGLQFHWERYSSAGVLQVFGSFIKRSICWKHQWRATSAPQTDFTDALNQEAYKNKKWIVEQCKLFCSNKKDNSQFRIQSTSNKTNFKTSFTIPLNILCWLLCSRSNLYILQDKLFEIFCEFHQKNISDVCLKFTGDVLC